MLQSIKEFSKGPGILISTIMWEFFSIYGLRALLIFFLTQHLSFSDKDADALYAAYISLIWISPLIGSWLADNYLGFKTCVIGGAVLIILGHIAISLPATNAIYLGLSLLICGIGLFKTNSICLISSYYRDQPEKLPSMMTLYYVGGNIGATIAPLVCAYLQKDYGYGVAFAAAALGMALGLITLVLGRRRLAGVGAAPTRIKLSFNNYAYVLIGLIAITFGLCFVLKYDATSYVLIAAIILTAFTLSKAIKPMSMLIKRKLLGIAALTLAAIFFWVLDQQGGSSISLFISRNVQLGSIPPAIFQSINPFIIILGGVFVSAWLAKKTVASNQLNMSMRVCLGIALLTAGYATLTACAVYAKSHGLAPIWGAVLSLSLIGVAELFIDPVLLAGIGTTVPQNTAGQFTAVYYLFTGALANYLSGKVAGLSALPASVIHSNNLTASANIYATIFDGITWTGVSVTLLLCGCIITVILKNQVYFKQMRNQYE